MKTLVIQAFAAKALRKHKADAERIIAKMEAYAADPAALANKVITMQGSTYRRLRVGNFRVIFEETATEVIVTRIGPRGSVYD